MPEVVDWQIAERVAIRTTGTEPFSQSYHYDSLRPDFERFTAQAEAAVEAETGLRSLAGHARARVTDRPGWVRANLASFRRLLRPLTDRYGERLAAGPVAQLTRGVAGAELGALLGWMSTRVLGQYDLLVIEDEHPEDQDLVYYVGPNVLGLERRFAFPPEEFRLWLALHEVTHRAQFTGVPWMREHFLGLVEVTLGGLDPDPARLLQALNQAVSEFRAGRNPLDDGGLAVLFANPEQRDALEHLSGLMSLLEGHGDVTMGRAGADEIPSAARFHRVLHQRRAQVNPAMKLLQKFIGLDAKMKQYEAGERFIEVAERAGGPRVLDQVWADAANLPTLTEIRSPESWLERMRMTPGNRLLSV
jgi:coenzyme F420 biosynthesis associated uncharacterized protein